MIQEGIQVIGQTGTLLKNRKTSVLVIKYSLNPYLSSGGIRVVS